jgi:hypothetical protein
MICVGGVTKASDIHGRNFRTLLVHALVLSAKYQESNLLSCLPEVKVAQLCKETLGRARAQIYKHALS